MNNRNFFLRYLKGEWLLQSNLFLFTTNKQSKNEQDINFNKTCYSLNCDNSFFNKQNKINYTISIPVSNLIYNTHISTKLLGSININHEKKYFFYSNYLLKGLLAITKINYKKKVLQQEYIYLVNQNLMINISLIKSFKGKYLGTKLSSYIKKSN